MIVVPEIRADIGDLLDRLDHLGFRVVDARYFPESFGNWQVELVGSCAFRLFKDRSQFMIDADRRSLEPAGLWRAFDDRDEFTRRVLAWAATSEGDRR
jgi:hypothetical protein